jgi:hypothetical protein
MSSEKKLKATPTPSVKPKKVKLVRDSFCMPKDEYAVLELLKQRALGLNKAVKKSELLRAGVLALSKASDAGFLSYIDAVPNLKTGRPATKATDEAEAKPAAPRRKPAAKPATKAPDAPTVTAAPQSTAPVKRASARKTAAAKTVAAN